MVLTPDQIPASTLRSRRRRRRDLSPERQAALDYAAELSQFADRAPDDESRSELHKLIRRLRVRFSHSLRTARPLVMKAITVQQASTVTEISEDTGLPRQLVQDTLTRLLQLGKIERYVRGGKRNAGRAGTTYYYRAVAPSKK